MLQKRPLRLVFTANAVSMIGSGMNAAAVSWYILEATHSEVALGTLVVLQTIPTLLLAPFSGVIIDREDRRRLLMVLDAGRGLAILLVALLCFQHRVQLWHLYAMNTLVAAGFWMFWPTINALIQELTPETHFVDSNTLLMAGIQGGWLIAGAVVGFVYNHIGLGGVLLMDGFTYVISFICYLGVRKGRHVVQRPPDAVAERARAQGAIARFVHETREGVSYLRQNLYVVLLGCSSSLLIGTMLAQNVVNPSLVDRILHAGAVGFGWINAGWGIGAFLTALCVPFLVRTFGTGRSVPVCMALLAACTLASPLSGMLMVVVALFTLMGAARAFGGIALNSSMMEVVPKYYMGRVSNTFAFATRMLQMGLGMAVGVVAHRVSLTLAFGMIAGAYSLAFITSALAASMASGALKPVSPEPVAAPAAATCEEAASGSQ
ncbi:MAG: MFS transporter [Terriglobales bacterium]